jgi:hypothetical protein
MDKEFSEELERLERTIEKPANGPMTEEQARDCVLHIKIGLTGLGVLVKEIGKSLLELEEREGWKALGYSSWRECATKEFRKSQSRVYELLEAARVERNISDSRKSESPALPKRAVDELKDLPPEQQREVMKEAIDTAPDGKVTAAHIKNVKAKKIDAPQPIKKPEREPSPVEDAVLSRIEQNLGLEARASFEGGEIKLKPSELKEFSHQSKKWMEQIYPLLAEGIPYKEAVQENGGKVITLSSRLDQLAAAWNENCKDDQVYEKDFDGWWITIRRTATMRR